ncbi:MAG: hypothetical protein GKR93_14305 [Gammaproteobacteria bacterium]|nr:hypothetical protein [Gammaproteobacteria bacterium]
MKRKLLLVLALIALPGLAFALGLGKLQLNSALNQPFDARIELLSASADELDNLNVGLADAEAFRRAKIDRPFVLTNLKFEVVDSEAGSDYIHITSREAIREPFLNFLLETNWSSGRLFREYTVLLDPPLYDPNARRRTQSESFSSDVSESETESYISTDDDSDTGQSSSPVVRYSSSEYGPTDSSDTLWSIASQVRPDSSVSVQQMMISLLRANPEAFINGNINGLKRGQILNIPSSDEIGSLSAAEAVSEVGSQNSAWPGASAAASSSTIDERADSMDVSSDSIEMDDSESSQMIEDDESELRLVAASSEGAGIGQSGGSGNANDADLVLANEQLQATSQENAELKDRVQEAETIINDLKRLIALKDDELAALQQQMAGGGIVEDVESLDSMTVEEEMIEEPVIEDEMDAVDDESFDEMSTEEDDFASSESDMMEEDSASEMMEDEMADSGDDAIDEMEEEMTEVSEEETEVATTEVVADVPAPAGIVEQALSFIMGNLIVIGGALGALIIGIIGLLFISRRKQNAATETDSVTTTEFPDFDEADVEDAESEATAESVADLAVDESEEETILPAGSEEEVEDADDKTAFVAPGDAPEPEAAPEPEVEEEEEEEEEEEDPLAEVNVLIAYEQFDQAEEFVRDAIANNPERADFHSKLLEVFYAANDKRKYEDAAQVLSGLVNSEGPHWEMAQAMWQEMSPGRALFEEGDDEPAEVSADSGGGMLDITAEEDEPESAADAGVDFDLGMDAVEEPAAEEPAEEESVLDITSSDSEDISVLDVTAAISVDESTADEDLLDVTSAVGLETEESSLEEEASIDDEAVLDITAGTDVPAEADDDVLDISHSGSDDLLDVTANANLEAEGMEEDLLDVTSAGSAEADGEELQELSVDEAVEDDDNSLDFDIGGMVESDSSVEIDEPVGEPVDEPADDNALDFDIGGMETEADVDDSPDLDIDSSEDDNALEIDLNSDTADENDISLELDSDEDSSIEDDGVELDLSLGDDSDSSDDEISLDESDDAPEIDLSLDEDSADDVPQLESTGADLDMDLTLDEPAEDDSSADEIELDMDFDLEIQDDSSDDLDIDMDGTVEMPKIDIDNLGSDDVGIEIDDDDDDDDDDDHTVFVPRAGAADEQTAEDEIATKLDLAKAYVELGDKDSAKGILDEVLADGSDEQKQVAQDLLNQLG